MVGDHNVLDRIQTPLKTVSSLTRSVNGPGMAGHADDHERGIRREEVVRQERCVNRPDTVRSAAALTK
jgi:hypothetical protein